MTDPGPEAQDDPEDDDAARPPLKMWKLMVAFIAGAIVLGSSILWLGYFMN